jgi:hypothetical protein
MATHPRCQTTTQCKLTKVGDTVGARRMTADTKPMATLLAPPAARLPPSAAGAPCDAPGALNASSSSLSARNNRHAQDTQHKHTCINLRCMEFTTQGGPVAYRKMCTLPRLLDTASSGGWMLGGLQAMEWMAAGIVPRRNAATHVAWGILRHALHQQ